MDIIEIRNADIIFVDILGVGLELGFKNEGVGLAAAIKRKYQKQKKRLLRLFLKIKEYFKCMDSILMKKKK